MNFLLIEFKSINYPDIFGGFETLRGNCIDRGNRNLIKYQFYCAKLYFSKLYFANFYLANLIDLRVVCSINMIEQVPKYSYMFYNTRKNLWKYAD